ncbi:taspase, threonine aspartase, 1 [Dinochytrium kinnereticum]|nr:taspase, threonine aspartase, 1 [Dinochytrium kinnereticum]
MFDPIVVVHGGVSERVRGQDRIRAQRAAVAAACGAGMGVLKSDAALTSSAVSAVVAAISHLESSPETNCGLGSNLNLLGKVECDASIMEGGQGGFGAVGGVQGLQNPIKAARIVMDHEIRGVGALGRVPAVMLVGDGARSWCSDRGAAVCQNDALITEEASSLWRRAIESLRKEASIDDHSQVAVFASGFDTVGAVAIDVLGNIAAGVSSGGVMLKSPGRVGHAAIFGSGIWASNPTRDSPGFGCSLSGTGEQIIKTQLASKLAESLINTVSGNTTEEIQKVMDLFLGSPLLRNDSKKSAGFIALKVEESIPTDKMEGASLRAEFCMAHTTESMCFGWMSGRQSSPKTKWSRKADGASSKIEVMSL